MIHYTLLYLSNFEGDEKKFAVFWNVIPCNLLNICQRFGEKLTSS